MNGVLFEKHLTWSEIESNMEYVLESPKDVGSVELLVRRPRINERDVIGTSFVDTREGLEGDNWLTRGSSRTNNGLGHPDMQLTLMNYRFAILIAGNRDRVPLAGDQIFADLDVSPSNLPPGSKLTIGSAVLEVTSMPHTGCKKFVERFGLDAMKFANSEFGRSHNLRGINARVISSGKISIADEILVGNRGKRL